MAIRKKLGIAGLLPSLLWGNGEASFPTLEEEYTPKYCSQLEAAYGEGLMSEGGREGIELMFAGIPLEDKLALDIGSGLGGVAFYLADKYQMQITGVEVNSWMVGESKRRTPDHLKDKVNFFLSSSNSHWPIPEETFHLIYSKGVLTHLETKDEIFQECHRLLKEEGLLVITDWLSSDEKKWGGNIGRLVELENLALYPESEKGYVEVLQRNGFTVLSARDDSAAYLVFNRSIVERLKDSNNAPELSNYFTKSELADSIEAYEAIANALEVKELRVLRFIANKGDIDNGQRR